MKTVNLRLGETVYRLRRYDQRNLILERFNGKKWIFHGYYNNGLALSTALIELAADYPETIPEAIKGELLDLLGNITERQILATAAVARQVDRLIEYL